MLLTLCSNTESKFLDSCEEKLPAQEVLLRNKQPGSRMKSCALWKRVWQFLKQLNIKLPYDPVIPLPSMYPREIKTYVH